MISKCEKIFIVGFFMGGYGCFKLVFVINCFFYAVSFLGVFSF